MESVNWHYMTTPNNPRTQSLGGIIKNFPSPNSINYSTVERCPESIVKNGQGRGVKMKKSTKVSKSNRRIL